MEDDQRAKQIRNYRRKLLLELANINLGTRLSVPFQRRLARFEPAPSVDSIREAQDNLRSTWSPIPSDFVLHKWLDLAAARPSRIESVGRVGPRPAWNGKDMSISCVDSALAAMAPDAKTS